MKMQFIWFSALILALTHIGTSAADVEEPYFCANPTAVQKVICDDKALWNFNAELEYELNEGMRQAIDAEKLELLDQIKNAHLSDTETRDTSCPTAANPNRCVTEWFKDQSRKLAATLTRAGLKSARAQKEETDAAEARRSAAAAAERAKEQADHVKAAALSTQLDAAPNRSTNATAAEKRAPITRPDHGTVAVSTAMLLMLGIVGLGLWNNRRECQNAQDAKPINEGGVEATPRVTQKFGWGVALGSVCFVTTTVSAIVLKGKIPVDSEMAKASVVSHSVDLTRNAWNCSAFGYVEFHSNGQVIFRNQGDATADNPVARVGYELTGTFTLDNDVLELRTTRQRAINGSPSDIEALGSMADTNFDSLRVLTVVPNGNEFSFTQTSRTFNGKQRNSSMAGICKPVLRTAERLPPSNTTNAAAQRPRAVSQRAQLVAMCKENVQQSSLGTTSGMNVSIGSVMRQAQALADCERLGQGQDIDASSPLVQVSHEEKALRFAESVASGRHYACPSIAGDIRLVVSKLGPVSPELDRLVSRAHEYRCL